MRRLWVLAALAACGDAAAPLPTESDAASLEPDASTALGTIDQPFEILSLPYTDRADTRLAPSTVFDAYHCEGDSTDESGGGFVYRLTLAEDTIINARLDDVPGDGHDVDIHLLASPDPAECLIRDGEGLSYALTRGTYYLVVDTPAGEDGVPHPGPFVLDVDRVTEQEAPAGARSNPIVIDRFPFSDTRDTSTATTSAFASYSCAPGTDEGGPELLYVFSTATGGALEATVDDVPGDDVDVDLHLLSAVDALACVARGNTMVRASISPGTYYLSVDSWVNGSGEALAGPYRLDVTLTSTRPASLDEGTVAHPIRVDQFPFRDQRSTAVAPSDAFDAYSCAPSTDEGGGEWIYAIVVGSAGRLQASLDDRIGDGIDVDLQLLSAPDAAQCLARDNRSISFDVSPGTYYLAVDTWVNGSGRALAGAYTLDVDLLAQPDLGSACVILYGDTRGGSSTDTQDDHRAVVQAIGGRCPAPVLVHSGDMVRSSGSATDWDNFRTIEAPILSRGRFYPVRGNHDGSWANIMNRVGQPVPQTSVYVVELSPTLTLIGLDSERNAADDASWLADQFARHPSPDHRFIVAFHRPMYPSLGGHAGFAGGVREWAPIFRRNAGRVLVVTGHNHGMSRELVDGVMYVTSGGGGAPLYGCGQAHSGTRYCGDQHGYYACDGNLRCNGYEISAQGEEIADSFSL